MHSRSWFFVTTPAPVPAVPERRPPLAQAWRVRWERLGERLAAWGDGARHHRLGSWETMRRGGAAYKGSSVK